MDHKKILNIDEYNKISLKGVSKKEAIKLYSFMLKLRLCEEAIEEEYHPADEMRCPVHFCVGQEAVPAALNNILLKEDYLFSHHRSHGYYLAKNAPMKKLFAELYGKITGANSGIAGSMDISYAKNNFYSGAILAGASSIALGVAMSMEMKKKNKKVVIAGFGDGATDEGIFWETLNYAGLKKLPIIFVCENNNYSTFSPMNKRQSGQGIAERARSFGVKSKSIFGNDVCLVNKEIKEAVKNARKGSGPFLLEAFTYRISSHVGTLDDERVDYRSKKEILFWKKNCPIRLFEKILIRKKFLNENSIKKINSNINKEIKSSFNFAKKSDFPYIDSWNDLNICKSSPAADKLLDDLDGKKFDTNQKTTSIKGF